MEIAQMPWLVQDTERDATDEYGNDFTRVYREKPTTCDWCDGTIKAGSYAWKFYAGVNPVYYHPKCVNVKWAGD